MRSVFLVFLLVFLPLTLLEANIDLPKGLKGVSIGGLWYLDFKSGEDKEGKDYSGWGITRGYINIKKQIMPWFHARVTPDVTRDRDGDVKVRLKYLYGKFYFKNFLFFTNNFIEIGQIHFPWLDFEEHVNPYRCQGTMFQERNHMFNSADQGIAWFGYFGGEMNKKYKEEVNKYYAGRYGSFAFGVYNGSGYHQGEKNTNKALETRITLRPLPNILPGLQFTYFGILGKGNLSNEGENYKEQKVYFPGTDNIATGDPPDWYVNTFFISYQAPAFTITAEYARDKGSQNGFYKGDDGKLYRDERDKRGFSFWGMYRIPWYKKLKVWARYDVWDPNLDSTNDIQRRLITSISHDIYKGVWGCMFLITFEKLWHDNPHYEDEYFGQTVLQLKF
ncbi:MAG TPA: hypothetical protein ENI35_05345 [Candidatus Desulfofervidus auxilii]|uniref:Porin n=1 Tax=Desulfofervidus auxilii TaxID=1621989 RepID=A0A7C1W0A8_DESA2|nr:hypothetical protein [Candidatus Desulfofervidus auxilii]